MVARVAPRDVNLFVGDLGVGYPFCFAVNYFGSASFLVTSVSVMSILVMVPSFVVYAPSCAVTILKRGSYIA